MAKLEMNIKCSDFEEVKQLLKEQQEKIERYENALKEISAEPCQYTYCGAEYIAKQALEGK